MRDPDFRLMDFLAADLRRYRIIILGQLGQVSWWQLLPSIFSPRFAAVLLCRLAYWFHCHRLGLLAKVLSLVNFTVFGIEVAVRCRIGKGLVLPHTQGTVIGAASIGEDATIFQGVTLGAKELDIDYRDNCRPTVGDGVLIGAGAKILGGVSIGHRVRIGANAVVLESLPDGVLAAGVPAKIVSNGRNNPK
ncbi:MAG TPA: serine O-acetyltransferase [Candidatus Angelobacter sp.]|jgi:serine O-acetyltransferase|nr:serine O-acetyltransferase [Candidatus Angelobacter sp.]